MKRLLYMLVAVLMIAACGDKNKGEGGKTELTLEEQLYGQWHSSSLAITADIYIDFKDNRTFELYQQIGQGSYRLYKGTWGLEGDLLTGKYNDGEPWATAYQIAISDKTLTMTSKNDAAEKSVYVKTEIPAEVKDGCVPVVKSGADGVPAL